MFLRNILDNREVNIMSKTELVELIAKEAGLSKADAARALDATIAGITEIGRASCRERV